MRRRGPVGGDPHEDAFVGLVDGRSLGAEFEPPDDLLDQLLLVLRRQGGGDLGVILDPRRDHDALVQLGEPKRLQIGHAGDEVGRPPRLVGAAQAGGGASQRGGEDGGERRHSWHGLIPSSTTATSERRRQTRRPGDPAPLKPRIAAAEAARTGGDRPAEATGDRPAGLAATRWKHDARPARTRAPGKLDREVGRAITISCRRVVGGTRPAKHVARDQHRDGADVDRMIDREQVVSSAARRPARCRARGRAGRPVRRQGIAARSVVPNTKNGVDSGGRANRAGACSDRAPETGLIEKRAGKPDLGAGPRQRIFQRRRWAGALRRSRRRGIIRAPAPSTRWTRSPLASVPLGVPLADAS